MSVQAKAKYIRMSPRKVRLVVDMIRGMQVSGAKAQLTLSSKAAARVVLKVLNSAVANAEHNNNMKLEDLKVVEAFVDEGPTIKRYKPRAHGRATPIRKRMSHITIVVGNGEPKSELKDLPEKKEEKKEIKTTNKKAPAKSGSKKSEPKPAKKKTTDKQSKK